MIVRVIYKDEAIYVHGGTIWSIKLTLPLVPSLQVNGKVTYY